MDTYVYGVTRAAAGKRPPAAGVDGQAVEVLRSGALAALVSDAPSLPVKANRRNLLAHSQVLQEVMDKRCVLPMRFGVVMPSRDAVEEELLKARGPALEEALAAFEPYVELDLKVLCPEDELLRAVVAERPDIRELRGSLAGRSEESTYYERIRLGELVAQAAGEKRNAVTQRIVGELEPLAAATEVGEATHEQMLANVSFLVERERVGEFDGVVERLGEELGEPVRLRYMGPLPAFNFVDLDVDAEAGAWA
jgi:hypothetical protein